VSGQFYQPIDDAARAALDVEDLGHGISVGPSATSAPALLRATAQRANVAA
jgi:hypothetical protein